MIPQKSLKQLGNSIIVLSSALTVHSWYLTMKDIELKKLLNKYEETNIAMGRQLENVKEENLLTQQAIAEITDAANKQIAHLNEVIAGMEAKSNFSLTKSLLNYKLKHFSQSPSQSVQGALNNDSVSNLMLREQADQINQINQANQSISQAIQDAVKSSNVNWSSTHVDSLSDLERVLTKFNKPGWNLKSDFLNSTNFLDSIKNFTESYKEWLDMLNVHQKGAVAHILVSALIFSCVTTLAAVYYSDALIKYFNLEIKYPRLAKYIGLRRQFQQYYFFLNTIIILVALIALIAMNLFAFSVYSD